MNISDTIIFDFTKVSNISSWKVVDDVVMGGESIGNFSLNDKGNGVFYGEVSLENNGGFSSLSYNFDKIEIKQFSKIILRVKGDGKKYQFRIKDKKKNYYSYVKDFFTDTSWQNIEINLSEMYPTFRGRKLEMDNFSSNFIEEVRILIGNKRNEKFKLEIDKIYLQ
ncbi:MAG: CIA30 family protein [Polaribacter sp.]|uniref:CIA30 family protein n=1 Tax=Polaribacter sp. TaxID=1920175 RepID=UPI003BB05147